MHRTLDDLRAENFQKLIDYAAAGAWLAKDGRHDWRLPIIVAADTDARGFCDLRTNELARTFGSTRKTICKAIARLLAADVIRLAGHTDDGRPKYVPNFGIMEGRPNGE